MITVNGRELTVPIGERHIGFENDNLTETRRFVLTDERLFSFSFKLDIRSNNKVGIVDLEKEVLSDRIILTWQVRREHICSNTVFVQLRAFSSDDEVWHSEQTDFVCGRSINATQYFPPELPSEFEQMEQRVTQAKNEAVEASENASGYALSAETAASEATKAADRIEQAVSGISGISFEIPPATKTTLGGVIVGENLDITSDGRLSVETTDDPYDETDNTKPITAAGVLTQLGNINIILQTI